MVRSCACPLARLERRMRESLALSYTSMFEKDVPCILSLLPVKASDQPIRGLEILTSVWERSTSVWLSTYWTPLYVPYCYFYLFCMLFYLPSFPHFRPYFTGDSFNYHL